MSWTTCKRKTFLRRLRRLDFVHRLLGARHQSSPAYQDWADYLERAPRVDDDFVAAMAELRRNTQRLEDGCRSIDSRERKGVHRPSVDSC